MGSEEPPGHAERDTEETSPQTGGGLEPQDAGAATGEDTEREGDEEISGGD